MNNNSLWILYVE